MIEIVMNSLEGNKDYTSDQQFNVPSDIFIDPFSLTVNKKPESYQECCSRPNYDNIYQNHFISPWKPLGNVNSCGEGSSCDMTASLSAWGGFKFTANEHDVNPKLFESISLDIWAESNAQLYIFSSDKGPVYDTIYNITSTKQTFTIKLSDIPLAGEYFHGLEIQNGEGSHQYHFNNIHLNRFNGSCDEYCGDGHTSKCSGKEQKPDDDDPSKKKESKEEGGSNGAVIAIVVIVIIIGLAIGGYFLYGFLASKGIIGQRVKSEEINK
ncbi:MAG: hypothetical protein MJ252_14720 [archaeon]|nr:hypothetical protein [archaeon]